MEQVNFVLQIINMNHTIYLQAILRRRLAAGHSGQYNTARRSEMRLSKIVRYSASLEFFVAFVLPDLVDGTTCERAELRGELTNL